MLLEYSHYGNGLFPKYVMGFSSLQKSISKLKIDFCRLKIQFVKLDFFNLIFQNQVEINRGLGNFVQGQPKVPGGYVQGPISSSILFKLYSIGDKLFVFVNSTTW